MFERYTEQARRALFFARYEVSERGSVSIEPEHLLLGLTRKHKGLTAHLFARFGISPGDIRRELEGQLAVREKIATAVEIPFSRPAKRVLEFTAQEADALRHRYIGTEHLLLGILREEQSVAGRLLIAKGLALQPVRDEIERLLRDPPANVEVDTTTHFADSPPDVVGMGFGEEPANTRWSLHLRDNAYWFHSEGQAAEGPYCVTCWEEERRWARKVADSGRFVCQHCGEGGADS